MSARLQSNAVAMCAIVAIALLAACSGKASLSAEQQSGANPPLPRARNFLMPPMQVPRFVGWSQGRTPTVAPGLAITRIADGLMHPRQLYTLPNGDVLVAETNAPVRPEDGKGIKGKVMRAMQEKAGAGVPSPDRITLLRDADGDGVAELKSEFLAGLHSPFGMALVGDDLYVANTDVILKFHYTAGATQIAGSGARLTDLPAGDINHHWTKNIIANADGSKLYATVGSNSNAAENGIAAEQGRAAIWEVDVATGEKQLFATGIRNPNGMAWEPQTGQLWTVSNERDELGDDLVPDYLTSVKRGAFYGWPYSYFGQHVDERVQPPRPDLVARAIPPDYALGAHVAALGLTYAGETLLPARFAHGMFVGEHGSWNRAIPAGYKVVFVPFADGQPNGMPIDVLTGFVSGDGDAWGRPVGVVLDHRGALLVADDVGNTVWRAAMPGKAVAAADEPPQAE